MDKESECMRYMRLQARYESHFTLQMVKDSYEAGPLWAVKACLAEEAFLEGILCRGRSTLLSEFQDRGELTMERII